MNELIFRITILTVSVIILAAVIVLLIKGSEDNAEVSAELPVSESIAVSETEIPLSEAESEAKSEAAAEPLTSENETVETTVPSDISEASEASSSRTIITSRVRKEYDSNSVYIDMENILQLPELPVGCEITALTILLRHCGFDAEKTDLAKNYLPISWGNAHEEDGKMYKDSFFDYFIGDPFGRGYGCFSGAIEKAANAYIADHGGGYTVKNISGAHPDVLYDYLAEGTPVLCWATDGMIEPEYYETWYDNETGEKLDWYLNEHCFVLAGFNMSADLVTLNDPMKGIIDYNINKFETRYDQMYRQAIVILPEENAESETETTETADITEETTDITAENAAE